MRDKSTGLFISFTFLMLMAIFSIGYAAGVRFGVSVGEVYCPLVNGEPMGECYSSYHVSGNCASLSDKRIICGEAYILKVI